MITFAPAVPMLYESEPCTYADESHPLAVSVTSVHAVLILGRLGYDVETPFGLVDADDLLGRAMVANVGRDDTGTDPAEDGNVTDCGARPGYFASVMDRLAALASAHLGGQITWG